MNLKCLILTGYFNTRCPRWWQNDIANSAGHEIDYLILSTGYKQIIDKPTHVVNNSMSISNYGVDVSIFDKCHLNITFGKVDIRVLRHPV